MQTTALKGARLSLQQERLWAFQQESQIYRVQSMAQLQGKLDIAVFLQALQQMVAQYEILQTVFYKPASMDVPIQVIGHHPQVHCPIVSLEAVAPSLWDEQLSMAFALLQEEPFDLAHGPLLRMALFSLSVEAHTLLVSLPALCADTLTLPLLITELCQRYDLALQGQSLTEEPLQYTAVSSWQQKLLAIESAQQPRDFWGKIDLTALEHMPLPFESVNGALSRTLHSERYRKRQGTSETRKITKTLEVPLCASLSAIALNRQVSLESVMLACWSLAYWRSTNEQGMVIGVASDGRVYEELKSALGLYTRFVPMSLFCEDNQTFSHVLTAVHLALQEAREWQAYFAWPADSEKGGLKFFPVLYEYVTWPATMMYSKLALSLPHCEGYTEPFAIKLRVLQIGEVLQVEFHYDVCNTSYEQIGRLACSLQTLLQSVAEQPLSLVDTLPILSPNEQVHLVRAFQASSLPLPETTLQQLFELQAQRFPAHLAVVSAEGSLTYQELNNRANQLAQVLRRRGVGPNIPVGLCVARSVQMLVGLLAIIKAGGAYLPLDAESPVERLLYQLQNAQAGLLLTQQSLISRFSGWSGQVLSFEILEAEMAQEATINLPVRNTPQDLVYIIYTSGSTGVPKGVMVQHRSVVNYTKALCKLLAPEPGWQFATVSALTADLGNTAIFCALASGGCVQILDYAIITSEQAFMRWATERPIDVLKIVPSHLATLLTNEQARAILPRKKLIVGGEAFPASLIARLRELQASCEIYNHYGPTETTIGVLVNKLELIDPATVGYTDDQEASRPISLGRPIANTDVYVLDPWLHIVPIGVTGELYIGGAGVTVGYLQQPDLTAQRFIPHPFVGAVPHPSVGAVPCACPPGARLYRTGDLARYTSDGQIEFVGRQDRQVKLRGYRIELQEIETVLRRHENVRSVAVLLREDLPGGSQLVAYIVPRKQPVPTIKELRLLLQNHLPAYMVPSAFTYLKALPLTASGKVDPRQLIATDANDGNRIPVVSDGADNSEQELVLARDEVEFQLLQIWKELLQIHTMSVMDNFFDLGGHSILAVRLMSHIYQRFGQDLSLAILFEHPTIAELAIVLRQQGQSTARNAIVPIQERGMKLPFFCVHPSGGTVFCYADLARCLGPDQPFYGLQTPYLHPIVDTWETLEDMAAHYVTTIQTVQPQGPYLLGGWSLGGVVALEIAQQLHKQGAQIALLAIIDSVLADANLRAETARQKKVIGDEDVVSAIIRGYELVTPSDFYHRPLDAQLTYVVEQAKKIKGIPPDISLEQIRLYYRTGRMNIRLARLYIPQSYAQPLDYFISTQALHNLERAAAPTVALQRKNNRLSPWYEIAHSGINLHPIEGDHGSMIEGSGVQLLANALRECIDRW